MAKAGDRGTAAIVVSRRGWNGGIAVLVNIGKKTGAEEPLSLLSLLGRGGWTSSLLGNWVSLGSNVWIKIIKDRKKYTCWRTGVDML